MHSVISELTKSKYIETIHIQNIDVYNTQKVYTVYFTYRKLYMICKLQYLFSSINV